MNELPRAAASQKYRVASVVIDGKVFEEVNTHSFPPVPGYNSPFQMTSAATKPEG
jgi:hypothetical protein